MPDLSIQLLGPMQVTLDGEPAVDFVTDKARALLAFLALEADRPHRREALAGLLWAEQSESSARANLRRALTNLRRVIGDHNASPPFLLITRQTIQFNRAGDTWVDVNAFAERVGAETTIPRLEEAVELYRGSFLDGFSIGDSPAFEEWSSLEREQLNRLVLTALHRLTDHHETGGDYDRALLHAWRRVGLDPWNEDAHRQVMRLLAMSGQRSAALSQYKTMHRALAEELRIEPEKESTQLHEQIRSGNLGSLRPQPPVAGIAEHERREIGECPYRGLSAFQETDAPFFHGRADFVERLAEAVRQRPVVAVIVGSSGSGKSSTVFAGLLPRLRREEGWMIAHFRPGAQPFHALARALLAMLEPELSEADRLIEARRLGDALRDEEVLLHDAVDRALEKNEEKHRLLLVVDQGEELYTLCPEPEIQRRFLDTLLDAVGAGRERSSSSLVLLIALRADFMGHALTYRPFADALQDASLMLGPMSRDELRLVIEHPAEQQGAALEAGLVERLLDDVGEEPGNLPLLEFALTLLWERQTDGWLTHAGYEGIGRVNGALARYADQVVEELDERRQERARQVFEQLVRPGEGTEDTRRMATRAELGDESWALVQHLADKRLIVAGRDATGKETAEVVHEALIQRWGRLRAWMDADRAFRTWQEGMRAALRGWKDSDCDDGALLRGAPLTQAESWAAERGGELSEAEQDFIEASVAVRERNEAERARRRRVTIVALTGGFLVAVSLAILAFNSRSAAQREADVNHSLVLAAQAEAVFENGDADLALALALEAVDMADPPPEAQRVLSTVALGAGTRAILEGHSQAVRGVAINPNGSLALSGSCHDLGPNDVCTRGETILWDLETGSEIARLDGHEGWVNAVAFSPDGMTALSGSDDATLILWEIETGEMIRRFRGHTAGVNSVSFSPDGNTALSGSSDATLILWDVATGEPIRRLEGHRDSVTVATLSPDGNTALSGSDSGTLILWDVATGKTLQPFEGHTRAVTSAIFHPDGRTVLSLGQDLYLRSWNLDTGDEEGQHTFGAVPTSLAITPDGRTALISVKTDVTLWDIGRWQEEGRLTGHEIDADQTGTIHSITISPNGRSALSAGSDGTLRLWNLAGQTVYRRFPTDGSSIEAVAVDSDGSRLLTGQGTGEATLWDVERGQVIRRYGREGIPVAPDCVVFSPQTPDGKGETSALVCAEDVNSDSGATSLVLWDLETGREVRRFEGHVTLIRAVAFSPDGHSALAGSQGVPDSSRGDLILWDLDTGEEIRRFDITHDVADVAMSADGSLALTASVTDFVAILWDVATGREIRRFEGQRPILNVAFGPQERTVFTASWDGSLVMWDMETGDIVRRFTGHEGPVWGLDISLDGRYAVTGAVDGTVILWDLKTGEELRRFAVHSGLVFDVAFHPDGQTFFSAGADGELIEWQVADPSLDELVEWIHANRYVRELTCDEQAQFHIEPSTCD